LLRLLLGSVYGSCSSLRGRGRLTGSLANLLSGVASRLADLTGGLADLLSEPLPELTGFLAEALPELTDPLADALTQLADPLAEPLPELSDSLAQPLTELADALPQLTDCSAGPERLAGGSAWPKRLLTELADVPDGVAHFLHETLEDLRVAVERRQCSIEDVVEVLQPHLQQCFRLDARDVDLDLAEMNVDAGNDLEQVGQFRAQGEMRLELLDVDVDLVDLDPTNVDEDVRLVRGLAPLEPLAAEFLCARGAGDHVLTLALRPSPVAPRSLRPCRIGWHTCSFR
jgi:hypothetical protein